MNKNKWDRNDIPSQSGKVAVVTGSSSGIGYITAEVLAGKGAEVIIAVRNLMKGETAAGKIRSRYKEAEISVMELDLADLGSVRSFCDIFKKKYSRLDLLINNAGVMIPPYSRTKDGFELQFGTNHLGHFALTAQIFDLIKNTSNSRIVNVSSAAHKAGNLNFDDLNWEKRKYKAWKAYGDSKISNLYFTYEMQRKLEGSGNNVIAAAAHPGWTATDLQRHSGLFRFLNPMFAQKPEMGALPTLYAAAGPDVKGGDYFGPSGWQEWRGYPAKVNSNGLSHDEKIAGKLWQVSEELTGTKYNFGC